MKELDKRTANALAKLQPANMGTLEFYQDICRNAKRFKDAENYAKYDKAVDAYLAALRDCGIIDSTDKDMLAYHFTR